MKKRIAMILALVIVASLALVGCGKGGNDKDALVGTWSGKVDITGIFNDEIMASLGSDAEGLEGYKDLAMTINLDLKADDTYTMAMDEAGTTELMESIKAQTKDILLAYMEKMIKDMGVDMTVEEAMEAAGISVDELMDEMFGADGLDVADLMEEISGKYMVKGGEIYLSEGSDEPEDVIPNPYKLDGNKLTIEADKLSDGDEVAEFMFPLVLEKVK